MRPQDFVALLKEKLEYNYAHGADYDGALATTIIATNSKAFRVLGIRPTLLGTGPKADEKVYALTNAQAIKALEKLGEEAPPKGLK